jgi:hypothetical protein
LILNKNSQYITSEKGKTAMIFVIGGYWRESPVRGVGIKTQMGTNLLNLFPSFPDKRTCHGARLRLFRLAAPHSRRLRFVSCFLTLNHPLQLFTTVISGFPFGFLSDSFREGVA